MKRIVLIQPLDGSVRFIPLTKGQVAIVDIEDWAFLSLFNWYAKQSRSTFYAGRNAVKDGKRGTVLMHQLLQNVGEGQNVDHINQNGLDNRRANLRAVTVSENMLNRGPNKNNTSGHKGVFAHKNGWQAAICIGRKQRYLGKFKTREEAIAAYSTAFHLLSP